MRFKTIQKSGNEIKRNEVVILLGYPYRVRKVKDDPAHDRFIVNAVYCGGDPAERALLQGFVRLRAGLKKNLQWNVRVKNGEGLQHG